MSPSSIKPTIPSFAQARVLVVGDVMLDRYWYGAATRISPEAPVPVVHVTNSEERAGGAGNVALNVSTLGAGAVVIGLIGTDEAGDKLIHCMDNAGVTHRLQRLVDTPTVTKLRVISHSQQLIRLDFEDGFSGRGASELLSHFCAELKNCDVVVLSDYGKGTLESVPTLIAEAVRANVPVLVDPKGNDLSRYAGASVVTPNLAELTSVMGGFSDETELTRKGQELMSRHDFGALLITRGEHGMTLLRAGQPELHLPTSAREVFDVTGAGDTVIATLAAGLAAGQDLSMATALANTAAGIVVGKLGTATASIPELQRALQSNFKVDHGVVREPQLLDAVHDARARGERLVVTNGCFDILHAGHVAYLAEARKLGDRLIVLVNDDNSVRRLKGDGRPVNSLEQRMAVLAALESVDWVAPFSEDTPQRVICAVAPDCLVKGGDYRPEDVAGYDCVIESDGKVVVVGYQEGYSTSRVIDAIRNSGNEVLPHFNKKKAT